MAYTTEARGSAVAQTELAVAECPTCVSSDLGWLLFIVAAWFVCWNLITERGTSRRAYLWISIPGTALDLFEIAKYASFEIGKHASLTYSIPHDDMLVVSSVLALLWLAFYGILNPGWWIFPIVTIASLIAKPKPSSWSTAVGSCLLAGLWIWGRVFDEVFLPKIYDALG